MRPIVRRMEVRRVEGGDVGRCKRDQVCRPSRGGRGEMISTDANGDPACRYVVDEQRHQRRIDLLIEFNVRGLDINNCSVHES